MRVSNVCLELEEWAPLNRAIAAADVDACRSFLASGEDPNLAQSDGLYPLICAATWARAKDPDAALALVELLVWHGAVIPLNDPKDLLYSILNQMLPAMHDNPTAWFAALSSQRQAHDICIATPVSPQAALPRRRL